MINSRHYVSAKINVAKNVCGKRRLFTYTGIYRLYNILLSEILSYIYPPRCSYSQNGFEFALFRTFWLSFTGNKLAILLAISTSIFLVSCGNEKSLLNDLRFENLSIEKVGDVKDGCWNSDSGLALCKQNQVINHSVVTEISVFDEPSYSIDGGMTCRYRLCIRHEGHYRILFMDAEGPLDPRHFPYRNVVLIVRDGEINAMVGYTVDERGYVAHIYVSKWTKNPYYFIQNLTTLLDIRWIGN